jgi:diguanylate cyclase (GGDEF)-like protein
VGYRDLLQRLLRFDALTGEERATMNRALSDPAGRDLRPVAHSVVRGLIQRGVLEIVERITDSQGPRIRLFHPPSGLRFSIQADEPESTEAVEVVPLPLSPDVQPTMRTALVRQLMTDQGVVVLSDRVAGPREIIQRMEPTLKAAIEADSVRFVPIDQPPGDYWRTGTPVVPILAEPMLRDLARARSYILRVQDLSRLDREATARQASGSALYVGIGDDAGGWRAVVEIHDARPDAFDAERMSLAILLSAHFQNLVATAVRLQSLIFFDFLTGLYNRPYFEDQIEKEISVARRRDQSLALLLVDIDNFKRFNTLYGYEGGDRVLVTVSCVLKAELRASDTIARYGGEEFAVLLAPPVGVDEARVIAERLRAAVEGEAFQVATWNEDYVPERITVSIGGALYSQDGRSMREIFVAANRMLLVAKRFGKNQVRFVGEGEEPPPEP